ncbi:MAG: DNA topoisomerase 3 [Hymenobacteraceae bacterium]|nr:DNA topoisomerase 3 [Hymenobacteraceae bacterium]
MKLCIAEKPSVAREIAQVIGATTRKDGYLEGNGYCVTWTFGHFCQLRDPEDYNPAWKRWSLHDLPMLPDTFDIKLMGDEGVKKQFGVIERLLQAATEVINCGDAGQEGEVIQRWVLRAARYRGPVRRLWISSLTEAAIRQGFSQLRDGAEFDRLYEAGKSRAVGDWLLGLNATRLFTLKYAPPGQVLSVGRVQTPTLAMVVQRWHEIQQFKPETYWELKTQYRDVTFGSSAHPNGRFEREVDATAALAQVTGHPLTITDVETRKATEAPPRLYDLTSLQVEGNQKLNLSADDALKTVQSLYEKKLVTYPRVDTTYLPNDVYGQVPGILQGLSGRYGEFTRPLLAQAIRRSGRVFNDTKVTDHHAIIPTGATPGGLGGAEGGMYDLIVRRFLAALSADCIVSNTTVLAEANQHPFRVRGRQVLEPGWRAVYGGVADDDPGARRKKTVRKAADVLADRAGEGAAEEESLTVLPIFQQGESGPHQPLLERKQTQPPKPYTEATLLRAMETAGRQINDEDLKQALKENGIGRPSTRAAILETLFRRTYLRRQGKQVQPTDTGIALIGLIQNPTLKSAELTGQWERKLRQIEAGELAADTFLTELRGLVSELVRQVTFDNRPTRAIPPVAKNPGANRFSAPAAPVVARPELVAPVVAEKPKRPPKPKAAPADPAVAGVLGVCPACGQPTVVRGREAWGCTRFREGCAWRLPFQSRGKTLTDTQLKTLLAKGQTALISGFKQADGQKFSARLVLKAGGAVGLRVE